MSEAERATRALLELMARLRDPNGGCPWDRQQSFATIAPYTIEEAYEVADAIDRNDPQQLRDELGDLLFQIVFHSRMAEEQGWFDFAGVATSIHDKLVRRHPHVFAGAPIEGLESQNRHWEELKARERALAAARQKSPDNSALADVPKALPALARAAKLGRRAARVGFDWQEPGQVRDKVIEELGEVDEALAANAPERVTEELGDLLFAIANWTLHLKIDPEEALRSANAKFERRFRHMESLAAAAGTPLDSLSPAAWEALWQKAKKA
ncbi:MAG: nucleoside triphosphate pyrophosphohydrolase [Proteobacteria bacterium]|nr:nucleoside triphosphate pyrophosphohydrolase [Pseudomonadota bacterium]